MPKHPKPRPKRRRKLTLANDPQAILFRKAMAGDTDALITLGKRWLHQRDQVDVTIRHIEAPATPASGSDR